MCGTVKLRLFAHSLESSGFWQRRVERLVPSHGRSSIYGYTSLLELRLHLRLVL